MRFYSYNKICDIHIWSFLFPLYCFLYHNKFLRKICFGEKYQLHKNCFNMSQFHPIVFFSPVLREPRGFFYFICCVWSCRKWNFCPVLSNYRAPWGPVELGYSVEQPFLRNPPFLHQKGPLMENPFTVCYKSFSAILLHNNIYFTLLRWKDEGAQAKKSWPRGWWQQSLEILSEMLSSINI